MSDKHALAISPPRHSGILSRPTRRDLVSLFFLSWASSGVDVNVPASGRRISYRVPLIPQDTSMSCWAAAIAMIISWAKGEKLTPLDVAVFKRPYARIQ
jgi:hypothetical protein